MQKKLSESIQDYLKHIYELSTLGRKATTSHLAEAMGISAASVTNMLQKLSNTQPPYVIYKKHHGVELTNEGQLAALKILRRHRLIEHYLVQKLGYTWDEVHDEAEILEHAISPRLEQRIDQALNYPEFDPHGDPIPDKNLKLPKVDQVALNDMQIGKSGCIVRVPHEDPQVLRYLGKCGLHPGAKIALVSRTPYDQTMRIRVIEMDDEAVIGPSLGGQIYVAVDG